MFVVSKNDTMKNICLLSLLLITFTSCSKEEKELYECNCGVVQSRNEDDYSVVLKNTCSNNLKTVYLNKLEFDTLKNNLCLSSDFGGRIIW